ncbi:PRD domain-containing protein [Lachnospiraceae bacterium OttesenSCG-928-J05]|nr:PRD domain-containing protein [Lachnospiraceae bacterium OttesenSCG-928-J05]
MEIIKIINNNIVSSLDSKNREIIVMGKGLGFGKKVGMLIEEDQIEKIFRMAGKGETKRFEDLLSEVPPEILQLVTEIVNQAKQKISEKIQESIYLTLTDHINFARARHKENIQFHNPLFYDIKRLYKTEYQVGKEAVALINERLGTDLPKEEAASIALHFINAKMGKDLPETVNMARVIQNTLKIIQYSFGIELEEDSPHAEYFIDYVKSFAQRVIGYTMSETRDEEMERIVASKYRKAHLCVKRIADYIMSEYKIAITPSESMDLTVQVERITKR